MVPMLLINYLFRLNDPAPHVLVLLILYSLFRPGSPYLYLVDKDIVTPGVKILSPRVPGPV